MRGAGKGYGHLPQLAPAPPAGPVGAGVTGTGLGLSACPGTTGQGAHKLPVWGEVRKGQSGLVTRPYKYPRPRNISAAMSHRGLAVGNGEQPSGQSRNFKIFNFFFFSEQLSRELNWVKRDHLYYF